MTLFAVYLFPVTNGKCSGVTRNSRARGQIPKVKPSIPLPSLPPSPTAYMGQLSMIYLMCYVSVSMSRRDLDPNRESLSRTATLVNSDVIVIIHRGQ